MSWEPRVLLSRWNESEPQLMRIKLHVKGIKGSGIIKEGEVPSVMFGGLLEIDGQFLPESIEIRTRAHEGFFEVVPVLAPGSFEVVTHTDESWPGLLRRLDEQKILRDLNGQVIARVDDEPLA